MMRARLSRRRICSSLSHVRIRSCGLSGLRRKHGPHSACSRLGRASSSAPRRGLCLDLRMVLISA